MCGRAYTTYTEEELEMRYLHEKSKRNPLGPLTPNHNLAPTQNTPIVYMESDTLAFRPTLRWMRWGLIPSWAKDIRDASQYSLINARSEDIETKTSYRDAFVKRRCIVPLSGFFEWKRIGTRKQPYCIRLKNHSTMSVAGVWEYWTSRNDPNQPSVYSFSILTTQANSLMEGIHNRMPVVLDPQDEAQWLDPEPRRPEELKQFLKPCPSDWLEAYEISPQVNSPRNNQKEILDPIQPSSNRG